MTKSYFSSDDLKQDQSSVDALAQTRVVFAFSLQDANGFFSKQLFDELGSIQTLFESFFIESIKPIPMASMLVSEASIPIEDLSAFRELFAQMETPLRFVALTGDVDYGFTRFGKLFAFGSSGSVISSLIRALVALPDDSSWCDARTVDYFQLRTDKTINFENQVMHRVV